MPTLRATFRQREIHDLWETAYHAHAGQRRLHEALLERALRAGAVPDGALVLDAGCGSGEQTRRLAARGFRCVGLDLSEEVLRRGREGISFVCGGVEELPFAAGIFDAVYCRGVLMHVPAWEEAVRELAAVLRPGGHLLLFENNQQAVELRFVRLLRGMRAARRNASRETRGPGGTEFWREIGGEPLLTRYADLDCLAEVLAKHGITVTARLASEFWDVLRFPAGPARDLAVAFNRAWLALGLPAGPCVGNLLLGEKRG